MRKLPIVVLAGRANVGKSTLFNRLLKQSYSMVSSVPGTTRDFHEGIFRYTDSTAITLVDLPGVLEGDYLSELAFEKSKKIIEKSDLIVQVVEARGLTSTDEEIALYLRKFNKPMILVVNKCEGRVDLSDFYSLGIGDIVEISAYHGLNVYQLEDLIFSKITGQKFEEPTPIVFGIFGAPNVGKSSLANAILEEERFIVSDFAGTTREVVAKSFRRLGKSWLLLDSAGIKRRKSYDKELDGLSVSRSISAMKAPMGILVIDASRLVTHQDKRIASLMIERTGASIIFLNKKDLIPHSSLGVVYNNVKSDLKFMDSPLIFGSALTGESVHLVLENLKDLWEKAMTSYNKKDILEAIRKAVSLRPITVENKTLIIRNIRFESKFPLEIDIKSNVRSDLVPKSYLRYLINTVKKDLDMKGINLRMEFKD
ncbi:ribosome-associated GTPase EngA [Thermodesulfobium narugense DSM 14796]|uniref:GTPase Der n=1 Tax=Thermodesulfobium narugense DSM 14796 TaxID=747365 RepID=M1E5Y0_9BACT|nr:ribosome biogenesis GTPase Der [Thermodesulfobium narugense]AEE13775.1 ribosome-associated GTPase EngA [Thermodesulfobium narugense DSM 14796]